MLEATEVQVAARLVHWVRTGDAAAEDELVRRYSRGVLFLARRLCGDPDQAEDIHQETFRIVLERLREEGLKTPEQLAAFIRQTVRWVHLGRHRKQARRRTSAQSPALERARDSRPSQLQKALRRENRRLVRRLLDELPTARDRKILFLYYIAEQEKAEVCSQLDLDSVHFNRVLFRAKERFRKLAEQRHLTLVDGGVGSSEAG